MHPGRHCAEGGILKIGRFWCRYSDDYCVSNNNADEVIIN